MRLRHVLGFCALAALVAGCSGGGRSGTAVPQADALGAGRATQSVGSLGTYTVDRSKTMSAGISSGGYEAVQLQVAYASQFHGSAIFAAGPYFCAQDNETVAIDDCSYNYYSTDLPVLEQDTKNTAAYGYNDPVADIKGQKSWIFSGTNDTTVYQSIVKDLNTYLQYFGVTTTTNFTTAAGHGWVTPDATAACGTTASPYLINCGFDAEQQLLTSLYGTLNARRTGTLTGSLLQFNQNSFVSGGNAAVYDMDSTGYVFVPAACASGSTCKILVALHGCSMAAQTIGTSFVAKSGLNEWADTNDIIVLYPQAIASTANPYGCWDWWGYLTTNYAAKAGPQMAAIDAMVQHL